MEILISVWDCHIQMYVCIPCPGYERGLCLPHTQTHSTSAKLEIFSLDLASPGLEMPLLGAVESPQRYMCNVHTHVCKYVCWYEHRSQPLSQYHLLTPLFCQSTTVRRERVGPGTEATLLLSTF